MLPLQLFIPFLNHLSYSFSLWTQSSSRGRASLRRKNTPHLHPHSFIGHLSLLPSLRTTSTPTTPSPHSTRRMTGVHHHPRCCQNEPVRCRAAAQTQSVSAINAAATMAASTPAWSLSSLHQVSRTNRQIDVRQMVTHTGVFGS